MGVDAGAVGLICIIHKKKHGNSRECGRGEMNGDREGSKTEKISIREGP